MVTWSIGVPYKDCSSFTGACTGLAVNKRQAIRYMRERREAYINPQMYAVVRYAGGKEVNVLKEVLR